MNETLIKTAKAGLQYLLDLTGADLLTCHFYNPHSQIYWLFSYQARTGVDFNYPWQLDGPVTHPDSLVRFGKIEEGVDIHPKENIRGQYFKRMPDDLKRNILAGQSFAHRENVCQTIRLIIADQESAFVKDDRNSIIIFLNYRREQDNHLKKSAEAAREGLYQLRSILLQLAAEPRLPEGKSWMLRSINLKLRNMLEHFLVIGNDKSSNEKKREIHQVITKDTCDLMQPNNGAKILSCSLLLLNRNSELQRISCHPTCEPITTGESEGRRRLVCRVDCERKEVTEGMLRYVALTGNTFHIREVEEYLNSWKPDDPNRPQYCIDNHHPGTQATLACPLIVQGRVVGVLNIDANRAGPTFDDGDVLMFYHICAIAAHAMRQLSLWDELQMAINHQHDLLPSFTAEMIFKNTLERIHQLDFTHTRIWYADTKTWYGPGGEEKNCTGPRTHGYTNLVIREQKIVALQDITVEPHSKKTHYTVKMGDLSLPTHYFQGGWSGTEGAAGELGLSDELTDWCLRLNGDKSPTDLSVVPITVIGFPVFSQPPGEAPRVCAVLWVKCQRYMRTITGDECWFLSLICENIGTSLLRRPKWYGEEWTQQLLVLQEHFGPTQGPKVAATLRDPQKKGLLLSREMNDIVIAHFDIRGSTKLADDLKSQPTGTGFVDFICGYHDCVFGEIYKCHGVVDKTIGDGIVAMFNLYRQDALAISRSDGNLPAPDMQGDKIARYLETKRALVDWILQMFDVFQDYKREFGNKTRPPKKKTLNQELRLGAGLCIGDLRVGSFRTSLLDYTAYGDAANDAGKLVNYAKADYILEYLKRDKNATEYLKIYRENEEDDTLSEKELKILYDIGLSEKNSILIADQHFWLKPMNAKYNTYMINLEMANGLEWKVLFAKTLP